MKALLMLIAAKLGVLIAGKTQQANGLSTTVRNDGLSNCKEPIQSPEVLRSKWWGAVPHAMLASDPLQPGTSTPSAPPRPGGGHAKAELFLHELRRSRGHERKNLLLERLLDVLITRDADYLTQFCERIQNSIEEGI